MKPNLKMANGESGADELYKLMNECKGTSFIPVFMHLQKGSGTFVLVDINEVALVESFVDVQVGPKKENTAKVLGLTLKNGGKIVALAIGSTLVEGLSSWLNEVKKIKGP